MLAVQWWAARLCGYSDVIMKAVPKPVATAGPRGLLTDSYFHPGARFQEFPSHRVQLGMKPKPRKCLLWNKGGMEMVFWRRSSSSSRSEESSVSHNECGAQLTSSACLGELLTCQWKPLWVRTKPRTAVPHFESLSLGGCCPSPSLLCVSVSVWGCFALHCVGS